MKTKLAKNGNGKNGKRETALAAATLSETLVRQPWERQREEPDDAWRAFCCYRDSFADERKRVINSGKQQWWCSKFHWSKRAAAYDAHVERLALNRSALARMEMHERHARAGQTAVAAAAAKLASLTPKALTVRDVAPLLRAGVEVERLARGETSDGRSADAAPTNVAVAVQLGSTPLNWSDNKPVNQEVNDSTSTGERTSNRGNVDGQPSSRETSPVRLIDKVNNGKRGKAGTGKNRKLLAKTASGESIN